ncbi:hypothetical protein DFH11DRAFT_1508133, partial [Phellopilus nigrolimitatus]
MLQLFASKVAALSAPLTAAPPQGQGPFALAPAPPPHAFWLADGDLVLAVRDGFFRIHAARLAAASAAFAALVSEAMDVEPADAESMDGCPFVRLLGDEPRDWQATLEAIYDPQSFQTRPVIFDTLAGVLRISTKYEIRALREWSIAQMRTTWPKHIDQMGPVALPHAAEAITVARLCGVPDILPAAFYALSVQKW